MATSRVTVRSVPRSPDLWASRLDGPRSIPQMSFEVAADAYDRFIGRYSRLLSPQLADFAGVRSGQRVLDVGCGPGALTAELVARLGASAVSAVDPSESFVAAARERNPGVEVQRASAEELPFPSSTFDAAIAQLVVHFMPDPVAGIAEMARVTRRDGVVAACVWDHAGGQGPLRVFWRAARAIDPNVDDESQLPGVREGHLTELFGAAGLREIEDVALWASVEHPTFESWWEPFTKGVGPAGAFYAGLGAEQQAELRERCQAMIPMAPFVVRACAWTARGLA
jgi:SAM-dependent methyltransferase